MVNYVGRFAPSPTGPLHFGSLIAATASYLETKVHQGKWIVRMEDLDEEREIPGAADIILTTLEHFGFAWDEQVVYQSHRKHLYTEALQQLSAKELIYPCACSRKEIADSAIHGIEGLIYPGTCRHGLPIGKSARAWRIRTSDTSISFNDMVQGYISKNLAREIGDFVLKRADGFFAYQLAVCVDDADQGVTHIVRGADLLNSTPRQILIQKALDMPTPQYAHVPVAGNASGEKLSKQTLAQALDISSSASELTEVLAFLGQQPPNDLHQASLTEIWEWAFEHWSLSRVPKQTMTISSHG